MSNETNTTLFEHCIELSDQIDNPFYAKEVSRLSKDNDLDELKYLEKIMLEVIKHRNKDKVIPGCNCKHAGKDDGKTTCWVHHNCYNGECTHGEEIDD